MCVCVCARACMRACVRVCVCMHACVYVCTYNQCCSLHYFYKPSPRMPSLRWLICSSFCGDVCYETSAMCTGQRRVLVYLVYHGVLCISSLLQLLLVLVYLYTCCFQSLLGAPVGVSEATHATVCHREFWVSPQKGSSPHTLTSLIPSQFPLIQSWW